MPPARLRFLAAEPCAHASIGILLCGRLVMMARWFFWFLQFVGMFVVAKVRVFYFLCEISESVSLKALNLKIDLKQLGIMLKN